jgi:hypothetical protein
LALQADLNLRTERRKTKRTGGIIIVLPDFERKRGQVEPNKTTSKKWSLFYIYED